MGMKAPVTGGADGAPREIPPEGNYLAVCNGVYMLGTQPGYQGGDPHLQLLLSFELHKRKGPVRDSQERVFTADTIMNFTFNIKSTLVKYAGALRGKAYEEDEMEAIKAAGGFDAETLLGLPCRLAIKHEKSGEKIRDKIESVSRLDPDDDKAPVGETDEVYWDWTLGEDCPKRIAYFWARALENPERKVETPANKPSGPVPGKVITTPADSQDNIDPDCPF